MTKLRNIIVLIVVIAALIFASIVVFTFPKNEPLEITCWKECYVEPGDTLWSLVDRNDDYDIREIIDIVEKKNHLKSGNDLQAHSYIFVPDWELMNEINEK